MAFSLPPITPARIRSTIFRMPIATQGTIIIIIVFYFLSWSGGFTSWAQLAPEKVFAGGGTLFSENLRTQIWLEIAHRLNTYPFLHIGLFHTVVNILALVTLLEKFEQTNGTITTVAMLLGRKFLLLILWAHATRSTNRCIAFSTFVGVLYVLLSYAFHIQYPIQGARFVPCPF